MVKRTIEKVRRAFYQTLPPSSHIAKRFKLTDASIIAIRAGTSVYGSQAQALLVAAEVLSRLREAITVPENLVAVVNALCAVVSSGQLPDF
jgi:hypothetical protein